MQVLYSHLPGLRKDPPAQALFSKRSEEGRSGPLSRAGWNKVASPSSAELFQAGITGGLGLS